MHSMILFFLSNKNLAVCLLAHVDDDDDCDCDADYATAAAAAAVGQQVACLVLS